MGAFLATPKTDKKTESGGNFDQMMARYAASSMQGWRLAMEDAHVALPSLKCVGGTNADNLELSKALELLKEIGIDDLAMYGVFDGHGSNAVSVWTASKFMTVFSKRLCEVAASNENRSLPAGATRDGNIVDEEVISFENAIICQALQQSFLDIDECLRKPETRAELIDIFEKGKKEQEGSHTYLEHFTNRNMHEIMNYIENNGGHWEANNGSEANVSQQDGRNGGVDQAFEETAEVDAAVDHITKFDSTNYDKSREIVNKKSDMDVEIDGEKKDSVISESNSVAEIQEAETSAISGSQLENSSEESSSEDEQEDQKAHFRLVDMPDDDHLAAGVETEGPRLEHPHPSTPEGSGTTSVVVAVVGGQVPVLVTGNAGDSRVVICRNGVAFPLTHDHKPTNPVERARIAAAGGIVTNGRVDGNLNLSRSLGDLFYKSETSIPAEGQRISAFPDIRITRVNEDDEFIIIACDGIWDCLTNQEAVDFVRERIRAAGSMDCAVLRNICEQLCDHCLSNDPITSEGHGCDNMTVLIVELANKLRKTGKNKSNKIILYGGGEDKFLGVEESDYTTQEDTSESLLDLSQSSEGES